MGGAVRPDSDGAAGDQAGDSPSLDYLCGECVCRMGWVCVASFHPNDPKEFSIYNIHAIIFCAPPAYES